MEKTKNFENSIHFQHRIMDFLIINNNFISIMILLIFDIFNQLFFNLKEIYISEFVAIILIVLSLNKKSISKYTLITFIIISVYFSMNILIKEFNTLNLVFWTLCLYYLYFHKNVKIKNYIKKIKKSPLTEG